ARLQHPDQHIGGNAGGKGDERLGGLGGGQGVEGAALEQYPHDGVGEGDEGGGSGHGQQHGDEQRQVLAGARLGLTPAGQVPRQFGQQHRADGDADDAERQLGAPVRIGGHRNGAVGARG